MCAIFTAVSHASAPLIPKIVLYCCIFCGNELLNALRKLILASVGISNACHVLSSPFHLGTYRANPLALAAGTEVIKRTPAVIDSVVSRGNKLLKQFTEIESDTIAQVRGKGFMIGIELGYDGKPMDSKSMEKYKLGLIKNGLVMHTCGHYGDTFRFMAALNIDQELLNTGMEIFSKVVRTRW